MLTSRATLNIFNYSIRLAEHFEYDNLCRGTSIFKFKYLGSHNAKYWKFTLEANECYTLVTVHRT